MELAHSGLVTVDVVEGGVAVVTGDAEQVGLPALRRLHELIARVNSEPSLGRTLQAVADGVVQGTGFEVAAVYYRHPDGTFEALAVTGPADSCAALAGQRLAADAFEQDFASAQCWGRLRFVPQDRFAPGMVTHWVPEVPTAVGPDAWHALDALFVPLHAPTGQLVGVLSVDLPIDGRRPGALQREMLELFAAQAEIAVDNARLNRELREEHHRLQVSEEAFRFAFDGSGMGMAMLNLAPGREPAYARVNQALCALTGYTSQQLLTQGPLDITHPDDSATDLRALAEAYAGQREVSRVEKRYLRADGNVVWVSVTTTVVGRTRDRGLHAISLVEDIGVRRANEEALTHRATHDPLTGLMNRHALAQRLSQAAERTRRSGRTAAVLFCDLDGFKAINDRFGHERGDAVLAEVAHRLTEQVRIVDTLARLGGDEFVVLAEEVSIDDVISLAGRLQRSVAQALPDIGVHSVSVSIGIALLTERSTDTDTLLRAADAAMYDAKANGGNQHRFAPTDARGQPPAPASPT